MTRLVQAAEELIVELMRYRQANSMSPLPAQGEETPALMAIIGMRTDRQPKHLTRSAIHEVIKAVMSATGQRLRAVGAEFGAAAAHI